MEPDTKICNIEDFSIGDSIKKDSLFDVNHFDVSHFDVCRDPKWQPLQYPTDKEGKRAWVPCKLNSEVEKNRLGYQLINSIYEYDSDSINELLSSDINLELYDRIGNCALSIAIGHFHYDLIRFLMQQGVDLDEPNDLGATPLHIAVLTKNIRLVYTLLWNNVNTEFATKEMGYRPIHIACENAHYDMVRLLCSYNVNLLAKDRKGLNPLELTKKIFQEKKTLFKKQDDNNLDNNDLDKNDLDQYEKIIAFLEPLTFNQINLHRKFNHRKFNHRKFNQTNIRYYFPSFSASNSPPISPSISYPISKSRRMRFYDSDDENEFNENEFDENEFETNEFETNEFETNEFDRNELDENEFETNEFETNEFETNDFTNPLLSENNWMENNWMENNEIDLENNIDNKRIAKEDLNSFLFSDHSTNRSFNHSFNQNKESYDIEIGSFFDLNEWKYDDGTNQPTIQQPTIQQYANEEKSFWDSKNNALIETTKPNHTKPNQTKPTQTKPNQPNDLYFCRRCDTESLNLQTGICTNCNTIYGLLSQCPWCDSGVISSLGSCTSCEFKLYKSSYKELNDDLYNNNSSYNSNNELYNNELTDESYNNSYTQPVTCACCNSENKPENRYCAVCFYICSNQCYNCNTALEKVDDKCWNCQIGLFDQ